MRQISQLTRESDNIFRNYFIDQAAAHLVSMSRQEYMELAELVYLGGHFARLTCKIQAALYVTTDSDKMKRALAVSAGVAEVSQSWA